MEPFAPADGRMQLAPGQRTDLIIDMSAEPGQRSLIEVVIGEYAYEVASFAYAQKARREQALEGTIRLEANPLQNIQLPSDFLQVPVHMEGGAMVGMRSAMYNGQKMDVRELVKNRKIWAINGIAGLPEQSLFSTAVQRQARYGGEPGHRQ